VTIARRLDHSYEVSALQAESGNKLAKVVAPTPVVPKVARSSLVTGTAPSSKVARLSRVPGIAPPRDDICDDGLNQSRICGLSGKNAWHYLENVGPTVNDIVEVHPDIVAKRAGQRWFMIVKKANVIQCMGKPCIELCRWCKTDTLEPCKEYKEPELCRIESVKAYGVREAPIFANVRSIAAVKPTPTQTQVTVESSSSDSDAKEMAAAAAAKRPKVTTTHVLAAVQRMSARPKPQVQEVCDGDEFCVCSKCLGY
jgi:hypothetical protein